MEVQFESRDGEDKHAWAYVQDSKAQRTSQNYTTIQGRLSRAIQRQRATAVQDSVASSVTYPSPPTISTQDVSDTGRVSAPMGWFRNGAVIPQSVQTIGDAAATEAAETARLAEVCEVDASVSIPESVPSPNATVSDADRESGDPVVSDNGLKRTIDSSNSRNASKRARSISTARQAGRDGSAPTAVRYASPLYDPARDSQATRADNLELKFRFGPVRLSLEFEGLPCIARVTTQDQDGIV